MIKRELLSPAGSMESLKAAVAGGADAVYLGGSKLNARESAENFDDEKLMQAVDYCHLRGVKVYLTLNTVVTDREIKELEGYIEYISRINIDGVIIQSLGLASVIKSISPELEIHASTQLTVHSLEGVRLMESLGFSRAVLSRELSAKDIKYICDNSPIEIEAFIHGALCMCYSGQCYFSSIIGQRSGNRGRCAQPCRLKYKNGYELSLKDLTTADCFDSFSELGVTSFKIEGRLKTPEYVYGVTRIYRALIDENRAATKDEMVLLENLFSRQGFTHGYIDGKASSSMFGVRTKENKEQTRRNEAAAFAEKTMPIDIYYEIDEKKVLVTAVCDDIKYLAEDNFAEPAQNRGALKADVEKQLKKTGGSGFYVNKISGTLGEDLFLPVSRLNEIRRTAVEGLTKEILFRKEKKLYKNNITLKNNTQEKNVLNFYFSSVKQMEDCKDILNLAENVWIPVTEIGTTDYNNIGVSLPRVIFDSQQEKITLLLKKAKNRGITKVLCNTSDQINYSVKLGFKPFGAYSLNLFNSYDLKTVSDLGLTNAEISPECSIPRIRDLRKPIKVNSVVYGRLPLMLTENCLIKNNGRCINFSNSYILEDKTGEQFPVICHYPHRNIILNSKPIYMADKIEDLKNAGIYGFDFLFTVETGAEIRKIVKMFQAQKAPEGDFTRGLYYKNVL